MMTTEPAASGIRRARPRPLPPAFPPACALAHSDVGRRERQEDAFALELGPSALVAAVVDGMGGYAGGDVAASSAAGALRGAFAGGARAEELGLVLEAANLAVREVRGRPGLGEAGAAVAALALAPGSRQIVVGWSGDCRVYRLRKNRLVQVTKDHNPDEAMVRQHLNEVKGQLVALKVPAADRTAYLALAELQCRGSLLRSLGNEGFFDGDLLRVEARRGDVFMLCTDGLVDHKTGELKLSVETVLEFLRSAVDPARELVDATLALGDARQDNMACVVVRA